MGIFNKGKSLTEGVFGKAFCNVAACLFGAVTGEESMEKMIGLIKDDKDR